MNFIKLIFIIFIINSLNGQAISTPKTIKPLMQVENANAESKVSFIGVEGGPLYQTAKLYDISQKNVLMPLERIFNFQACAQEGCVSYFSGGHYGDITGDGVPEVILLITNPSYGTQVLAWTIQENGIYKRLNEPYLINSKKNSSEAVSSFLERVYPDKDKELVVSLGSPDRKIVILDYVENFSSKTIAEEFLENTVGPLVLKVEDFNNDNLKDIYILNNGRTKQEQIYLSPEHKTQNKSTDKQEERLKDVGFYVFQKKVIQINLLQNDQVFVEGWKKTANISIDNPIKILSINNNEIFILNNKGDIAKYLIDNDQQVFIQTGLIKNQFKQTKYDQLEFLLLNNSEIILSHNKNPEIILSSLIIKEDTEQQGQQKNQTKTENKQIMLAEKSDQGPKKLKGKEKKETKEESTQETKIVKLDQDTIFVNVGEPTTIKIVFNSEFEFLDLEEKRKPIKMNLDVPSLSFMWTPSKEDAGYNNLDYVMSYNKNTNLERVQENGKVKLKKTLEKTQTEHGYVIFVNSPPEIKIDQKTYTIQENKELIVPIYIKDINSDQSLSLDFNPSSIQKAFISDRKFYWTPNKTDYGKNNIEFVVSDGKVKSYENISVIVDTVKVVLEHENEFIATVNKEFIHRIAVTPGTQLAILKGPENLRISKEGILHWIPTSPEIGNQTVQIELQEKEQTSLYQMKIFVNSEPIISYRPNLIEYINFNEEFSFVFRSFDQNINQELYWSLKGPRGMEQNNHAIKWKASEPDYVFYTLSLTDQIDTTEFNGMLYVNDIPKITSTPPQYMKLGDTLNYTIIVEDINKKSAFNMQEQNDHIYFLETSPKEMILQKNKLTWIPKPEDIGPHQVKVTATDGLSPVEQSFTLFINDQPRIISGNELKIQVGDTLHHFIQAQDANALASLAYGIISDINTMTLNGKTGEIFWAPQETDVGKHQIKVSVSDGFDLSKDVQIINISVYKNPQFDFEALPEAYAGNEYKYTLKAHNMFLKTVPEKDVFIKIKKTTIKEIKLDTSNYSLNIFPSYEEVGKQSVLLSLSDGFDNKIEKDFVLKVLVSPCETIDTVYINNEEVISRLQKIDKSIVYASKNEKIKISSRSNEIDTIYITKYDTTITNITDSIFVVLDEKQITPIKELSKREKRKLSRQTKRTIKQTRELAKRTKNLDEIVENKEKETEEKKIKKQELSPLVVKTEHKKINIINRETIVVEQVLSKKEEIKDEEDTLNIKEKDKQIKFSIANSPVLKNKILGIKTTGENQFNKHLFTTPPEIIKPSIKTTLNDPEDMLWYKE